MDEHEDTQLEAESNFGTHTPATFRVICAPPPTKMQAREKKEDEKYSPHKIDFKCIRPNPFPQELTLLSFFLPTVSYLDHNFAAVQERAIMAAAIAMVEITIGKVTGSQRGERTQWSISVWIMEIIR
jgi:hypothetical protein